MIIDTSPLSPPRRRRSLRVLAAVVPALLLLSACAPPQSTPQDDSSASSIEEFYEQEVALEPCETPVDAEVSVDGECGFVQVPLDYEDPAGDVAEIAVFRVPATGDDPIGSLLTNPGGPGSPGITYAAQLANGWADSAVAERFDIIGFDPRGTGATTPVLDCHDDTERDQNYATASQLSYPGAPPLVEACADSVGGEDALAHIGTRDVVRDMDVIRAVLGDDQLTFAGASYGTRLGAVYAEMFPENVRALVLDGAMDPHAGTLERRVQQWTAFQTAFDQFAAFCIDQGDCPLGDDVDGATAAFQDLAQPLTDQPVPAGENRELGFVDISDAMVTGMYSQASWPVMIDGLTEVTGGRGDTLLAMRDFYQGRTPDGSYSNFTEATLAINCLDEERFTPEGQTELLEKTRAAAPFLDPGTPIEETPDLCEGWPVEPTLGYPYATDIEGLADTLTVSVTGDALTPHEGGISLAETLGGSLLTVEGGQHGTLLAGNECVDTVIADYLIDLEVPADGDTCRL